MWKRLCELISAITPVDDSRRELSSSNASERHGLSLRSGKKLALTLHSNETGIDEVNATPAKRSRRQNTKAKDNDSVLEDVTNNVTPRRSTRRTTSKALPTIQATASRNNTKKGENGRSEVSEEKEDHVGGKPLIVRDDQVIEEAAEGKSGSSAEVACSGQPGDAAGDGDLNGVVSDRGQDDNKNPEFDGYERGDVRPEADKEESLRGDVLREDIADPPQFPTVFPITEDAIQNNDNGYMNDSHELSFESR